MQSGDVEAEEWSATPDFPDHEDTQMVVTLPDSLLNLIFTSIFIGASGSPSLVLTLGGLILVAVADKQAQASRAAFLVAGTWVSE